MSSSSISLDQLDQDSSQQSATSISLDDLDKEQRPPATSLKDNLNSPLGPGSVGYRSTLADRAVETAFKRPPALQEISPSNKEALTEQAMSPENRVQTARVARTAIEERERAAGRPPLPASQAPHDPQRDQPWLIHGKTGTLYQEPLVPEAEFADVPMFLHPWDAWMGAEKVAGGLGGMQEATEREPVTSYWLPKEGKVVPWRPGQPVPAGGFPIKSHTEETRRLAMGGAAETVQGLTEAGTVAAPAAILSSPLKVAAGFGAGYLASEAGGAALHRAGVSPETEELGRQLLFFAPSAAGIVSGLRTGTIETPQGRFSAASVFGGRVRAGVATTPEARIGRIQVGETTAGVTIPRGGAPVPPPSDAAKALMEFEQSSGNPDFQPPPPRPAPPSSNGPEHLTHDIVRGVSDLLQQSPPAARPKLMLEAHQNMTKWMIGRGTFVGPDSKVYTVDNVGQAKKLASTFINDEVDRIDKAAEEADKTGEAPVKAGEKTPQAPRARQQEKPATQATPARQTPAPGQPAGTVVPPKQVLPTTAPVSGKAGNAQPMGHGMTQDSPAVAKVAQEARIAPGQEPLVMVKKETPRDEDALAQPPTPVDPAAGAKIGEEDKDSGRTIVQPSNNEMQNERLAGEAAPILATQLSHLSASVPGITFDRIRPQKNLQRVDEKVEQDEKPPRTIQDYLAGQVAADTPQAKDQLIAEMRKSMDVLSVEDKFLEGRPDLAGYPSANVQVRMPNGSTAEIQIVPREVQEITDTSHRHYTEGRKAELAGDLAARDKAHAEAARINKEALGKFKERNAIGGGRSGGKIVPPEELESASQAARSVPLDELDSEQSGTVGTVSGARTDTEHFRQARENLGETASISQVAQEAQRLKTAKSPPGTGTRSTTPPTGGVSVSAIKDQGPATQEIARGQSGEVYPQDLTFDPKRFQYKLNVNEKGVTNLLSGRKWNPDLVGIVSVWRDPADGKLYVINGHHRARLALDNGVDRLLVRHIDVKDASEARARGALQNIAEGRGTAVDAAKFFRERGITPADLDKHGISMGEATATNGLALSRLDDSVFEKVATGQMTEARGVAIGHATDDPAQQEAIVKLIDKQEARGRKITNDTVAELARFVASSGNRTVEQGGLFGANQEIHSLALEKAEISAYIKQQIAKERRAFGAVSNEERAKVLGRVEGQQLRAGENKKISEAAAQAEEAYNKLSSYSGPINDALEKAARELTSGNYKPEDVKQRAYSAIRDRLREAVTGGQGPDTQRPKGASGIREGDEEALTSREAVVELPSLPLKDNYRKPLSEYTPILYHETSVADAARFLGGTIEDMAQDELFFANTPDLALGQGRNRGVLLELDSRGIRGRINTAKPAWEPAYQQGLAEFVARLNQQRDYQAAVRSVTVKTDAKSGTRGENLRLKNLLADRERAGWTKAANADGSVTYRRPEAEQPLASLSNIEPPLLSTETVGQPVRFETGKNLTPEERSQVIRSMVDVYKAKNAPKEVKGQDRYNGDEIMGYAYSPELFEKSDITGRMVRRYITLPDGRKAHPSELFPELTDAAIDRELIKERYAQKQQTLIDKEKETRAVPAGEGAKGQANLKYHRTNRKIEGSYFSQDEQERIVRVDGKDPKDVAFWEARGFKQITEPALAPAKGGEPPLANLSNDDLLNWAREAGGRLKIEEFGEQGNIFGGQDKMYRLSTSKQNSVAVTDTQMRDLAASIPAIARKLRISPATAKQEISVRFEYQPPEPASLFVGKKPPILTISAPARDLIMQAAGTARFNASNLSIQQARKISGALRDMEASELLPEVSMSQVRELADALLKASKDAGDSGITIHKEGVPEPAIHEEAVHAGQRQLGRGEVGRHLQDEAVDRVLAHPASEQLQGVLRQQGYSPEMPKVYQVAEMAAKIATGQHSLSDDEAKSWFVNYVDELHKEHDEGNVAAAFANMYDGARELYEQAGQTAQGRAARPRGSESGLQPPSEGLPERATGPPKPGEGGGRGTKENAPGKATQGELDQPFLLSREHPPIKGKPSERGAARMDVLSATIEAARDAISEWREKAKERQFYTKEARELEEGLVGLDRKYEAGVLETRSMLKSVNKVFTPEEQENVYHAVEAGNERGLSAEERNLKHNFVDPVKQMNQDLHEELTGYGWGDVFPDTGYIHRIVQGKPGRLEKAVQGQQGGKGNLLSKTTPSTKQRSMFALEDEDGHRVVVHKAEGRVTGFEAGKAFDMGRYQGGLQSGATFTDKDGQAWKLNQATTKEIEDATDLRYYKNAMAVTALDNLELQRAVNAARFLESFKARPEFDQVAIKADSGDPIPQGWKQSQIPQFRGYAFEPRTREVLDALHEKMTSYKPPGILEKVGDALQTSVLLNPLMHVANMADIWGTERGLLKTAQIWKGDDSFKAGLRALRAVTFRNDDYLEALSQGAPLMSHRLLVRDLNNTFQDVLAGAAEDEGFKTKLREVLALPKGINPIEYIRGASHAGAFMSNDVFLLQSVYDKMASNRMTFDQALRQTMRTFPEYRLPTRVLDSKVLADIMRNRLLSWFAGYHYGKARAFKNMAWDSVRPGASAEDRTWAMSRMAMLAMLIAAVYPAVQYAVKKLSGDQNAHLKRFGLSSTVQNMIDVHEGRKAPVVALESEMTPSALVKAGTELLSNQDYRRDYIYDPTASATTQIAQAGEHVAKNFVGPVSQYERYKNDPAGTKKWLWSQIGVTFPRGENDSPAMVLLKNIRREHYSPHTPQETQAFEDKMARIAAGKMTLEERRKQIQNLVRNEFENGMKEFSYDDAKRVYDAGSPEEKAMMARLLLQKHFKRTAVAQ